MQWWGNDDRETWEPLWSIVRGNHKEKLEAMLFLEQHLSPLARRGEMTKAFRGVLSEDRQATNLHSIYVDLEDDGRIEQPQQVATDARVQRFGRDLRKSIATWGVIIGAELESRLDTALQSRTETDSQASGDKG